MTWLLISYACMTIDMSNDISTLGALTIGTHLPCTLVILYVKFTMTPSHQNLYVVMPSL